MAVLSVHGPFTLRQSHVWGHVLARDFLAGGHKCIALKVAEAKLQALGKRESF